MAKEAKDDHPDKDKDTQETESKSEQDTAVDWEKRYKDEQVTLTKSQQENAEYKRTLEQLYPYVNWDKLQSGGEAPAEEEDGYISRKEWKKQSEKQQAEFQRAMLIMEFRAKHPDMIEYEDLVTTFMSKTDARKPLRERADDAVKFAKNFLEAERAKGKSEGEKAKEEREAKEAEAAGLEAKGKSSKQGEEEEKPQTPEEYLAERQKGTARARNLA